MTNIKVSIIVLTQDRAKYLTRCLASISDQVYTGKIEVIVVMDNCTDDTKAILELWEHGGDNRTLMELQGGGGIGYAAHMGVMLAKGEYIVRLDDDDWWSKYFLACMVPALDSNPDKVSMRCMYNIHNQDGLLTPNQAFPQACNIIWRASALRKVNYNMELKRDEDVDIIKRMEREFGLDGRIGSRINEQLSVFLLVHFNVLSFRSVEAFSEWLFEEEDDGRQLLAVFLPFAVFFESQAFLGPGLIYYTAPSPPSLYFEGGIGYSSVQSISLESGTSRPFA